MIIIMMICRDCKLVTSEPDIHISFLRGKWNGVGWKKRKLYFKKIELVLCELKNSHTYTDSDIWLLWSNL